VVDEGTSRGTVLVIGSSNTDLVCLAPRLPRPGETVRGTSFATFAGGKGANQAVAAARAGARVCFAGAVGDDTFGQARLADLRAENIDIEHVVVRFGVASGVASIVVDDDGENVIVLVPGANDTVDPAMALRALQSVEPRVLSLTHEVPFETVRTAILARAPQTLVVHNTAPYDERIAELLDSIDVLICNETEASALLDRPVTADTAEQDAAEILARGCRAAIITLGAHGAFVATDATSWHVPAPNVAVVDTTGAGDALCGATAAWLASGAELRDAVVAGVVAGSLAVTRDGAQPSLPTRSAILALIASIA
jgi:ribokinase